jgi:ATP-dependent Clp protease ATP-binding subunit ClpA
MFERFATTTRRLVVAAETEARDLGHAFIDPLHLVLAMLAPDPESSPVRAMLLATGLDEGEVRDLLAGRQAARSSAPIVGTIPLTAPCKKVLELAFREALVRNPKRIEPEHLLLAMLRDRRTDACRLLSAHGVTPEHIKEWMENPSRPVLPSLDWLAARWPYRPPRFTTGGRVAVTSAQQAAGGIDQPVGTQHLLLGLLAEERGVAAQILRALGVTTETVEARLADLDIASTSDGPPATRVNKVGDRVEVHIDDPNLAARLSAIDAAAAGDVIRRALLDHLEREADPEP